MKKAFLVMFLICGAIGTASAPVFSAAGGDITFSPAKVAPVRFSHDMHTKFRGVRCMACHFDRFSSGNGSYVIRKETMNKRDFCGHCHNGMKAFDQGSAGNCGRCHKK